ncbi:MAG: replicative DNA helicase [Acidimicrobiia bacterium]|nr:replicative DNA helicase [Acidimicrobiia bacterium]
MTTQLEGPRTHGAVPPHNVDAEESVLGAVMLSPDAANVALEKLTAEDFYKPAHQLIFEAVVALFDGNQPIDAITVSDHLRRTNQLDRVGGVPYLTAILDGVPTTSNVGYYADIVDETAARRRLMKASSQVNTLALQTERPIAEVLDSAEAEIFKVAEKKVGDGLQPLGPILQPTLEKIEELGSRGDEITGLPTGFRDLDRMLAGLQPANLVVVAARPSMGKSALALNIAQNVAEDGHPVAIFTLEMSREEVVQRLLSSMASVDSQKLRTGQLSPELWQKVVRETSRLYQMPMYVDDSPDLTVTAIRAKCRRMKRKEGLGLVVVDYLQLMQGSGNAESRQQEIADISRSLKNLARELHVPVIGVSQLNRALEQRENKRPRLGDLRESGAIEQDADIVMFIYRDEYYNAGSDQPGAAEINIAKHRAGAVGTVMMNFAAEFTRFRNFTSADPL